MGRGGEGSGSPGRRARLSWPLALLAAFLLGGGGVLWLSRPSQPVTPTGPPGAPVQAVALRETRATLDPELFVGKARLAHQVAREIPGILDQLYCYCACDKHLGHRSLLSCFTDGHAAT